MSETSSKMISMTQGQFARPSALGIHEISKEQYFNECRKGLKILNIMSCGSGNPARIQADDVLMVSMCKPGSDEPHVSYTRISDSYLFTKGYPWNTTPLVPADPIQRHAAG